MYETDSLDKNILSNTRVWLYGRLSRDDDHKSNSIENQLGICQEFANENYCNVVGKSFDDNVSGMSYSRDGLFELSTAVEAGTVDTVIVKDISRLGRHLAETVLYVEMLRSHKVRVISVREHMDTFNPDHQTQLGFTYFMNNHTAIEASQKISHVLRYKQKQGLIISLPFGYFKDRNTGQIMIVEECADIIRLIYNQYLEGHSFAAIIRFLRLNHYKTPSYYQWKYNNRKHHHNMYPETNCYNWGDRTIKSILKNETYTGVLINHKTEANKTTGVSRKIPSAEQYRHEGFLPVIIARKQWHAVQKKLAQNNKSNMVSTNRVKYSFSGLLRCGDCGSSMTAKKHISRKNNQTKIVYVCTAYHRNGRAQCSPHYVHESDLHCLLAGELERIKKLTYPIWENIKPNIQYNQNTLISNVHPVCKCKKELETLKSENKHLVCILASSPVLIDEIQAHIVSNKESIIILQQQIDYYRKTETQNQSNRIKFDMSVDSIFSFFEHQPISNHLLRLLVDKIDVYEGTAGIELSIAMRGDFKPIQFTKY